MNIYDLATMGQPRALRYHVGISSEARIRQTEDVEQYVPGSAFMLFDNGRPDMSLCVHGNPVRTSIFMDIFSGDHLSALILLLGSRGQLSTSCVEISLHSSK
jgi:hypothetical protein